MRNIFFLLLLLLLLTKTVYITCLFFTAAAFDLVFKPKIMRIFVCVGVYLCFDTVIKPDVKNR